MKAASAEAKLVSDSVVFKFFFATPLLNLVLRKLRPTLDQIRIVFLSFFSLPCVILLSLFSLIKIIKVETLVVIENLFPDSVSLLSMILEVFTITYGEENFFKRRDRDAITRDSQGAQPFIELMEEIFKLRRVFDRYLEGDFTGNLRKQVHIITQVGLKVRLNAFIFKLVSLLQSQVVADTIAFLQEQGSPEAY